MGILGELNQLAKSGQIEQLRAYLGVETDPSYTGYDDIPAAIRLNDPRTAGAHRRAKHHNDEISIASFR